MESLPKILAVRDANPHCIRWHDSIYRDSHAKLRFAQNDEKLNFEFVTDERSKRRGQIYLQYALQEGGNEDLLLVILNFELQNVSLCGFWNLLTH